MNGDMRTKGIDALILSDDYNIGRKSKLGKEFHIPHRKEIVNMLNRIRQVRNPCGAKNIGYDRSGKGKYSVELNIKCEEIEIIGERKDEESHDDVNAWRDGVVCV